MTATVAERLQALLQALLGDLLPVRVRGWDDSEAGPTGGPVLVVRSRRAVRRLLWQPNELGLARAWVAGDIDLEGDLYEALVRADFLFGPEGLAQRVLGPADRRELMRTAVLLGAVGPAPRPPAEELSLAGERHTVARDRAAFAHHYNADARFYRVVYGDALAHTSAAPDPDGRAPLADLQRAGLDLVAARLGLAPGMRLLDVGCGWGTWAVHAAERYGVEVVGLTLAREQAETARKRAVDAGVAGRVEIRLHDWRELDDASFDAATSLGMAEYIGAERYPAMAGALFGMLAPGGRLLVEQVSRRPGSRRGGPAFAKAYLFPDGGLLTLGRTVTSLEEAGFEVREVEALRERHAQTVRTWVANLQGGSGAAAAAAGEGRVRVWLLHLASLALALESGRAGYHRVLAVRAHPGGRSEAAAAAEGDV